MRPLDSILVYHVENVIFAEMFVVCFNVFFENVLQSFGSDSLFQISGQFINSLFFFSSFEVF